jgi:hypothetical protein
MARQLAAQARRPADHSVSPAASAGGKVNNVYSPAINNYRHFNTARWLVG